MNTVTLSITNLDQLQHDVIARHRFDCKGGTIGSDLVAKAASDGNMKMDCASGFGAVTPVTATFGLVAASRVLKKIAERGARAEKEAGNEEVGSISEA